MPLYPTFEDLKVDGILQAQNHALSAAQRTNPEAYVAIAQYMGLDLNNFHYNDRGELVPGSSPCQPAAPTRPTYPPPPFPLPELPPTQPQQQQTQQLVSAEGSRALVSASCTPGEIKHGIRSIVLCKNGDGKVGVQLKSVDNGVFVSFVQSGSPAALAGLRFGDQVLSIRDTSVAGYSGEKAMKLIRKAPANGIEVVIRDRPFERTLLVNKSSMGEIGLTIRSGLIVSIVKDSSAARNGLTTGHQLVEVNGQNVLGLPDKQIKELLHRSTGCVRLTVLPITIYEHMVKNLWKTGMGKEMDRSMPDA